MNIPESLTRRENEVVDLVLKGMSNKQIALALRISERTVEFHLNNIYAKLQLASRVELILKIGKAPDSDLGNPVESTVVLGDESPDNGSQPVSHQRWAHSLRNTVVLIKREVTMTIQISFEELENYLKRHPVLFCLLILFTASLTTRYVLFDLGLYFWVSYLLLGFLLGAGSIRFGRIMHRAGPIHPLRFLLIAAGLPLIAAGFDQLYVNTAVRFTGPITVSIANITTTAQWVTSPEGAVYRSTQLSTMSDLLWFIALGYMVAMFLISRMPEVQSKGDDLARV